jgi:hypothetical protein
MAALISPANACLWNTLRPDPFLERVGDGFAGLLEWALGTGHCSAPWVAERCGRFNGADAFNDAFIKGRLADAQRVAAWFDFAGPDMVGDTLPPPNYYPINHTLWLALRHACIFGHLKSIQWFVERFKIPRGHIYWTTYRREAHVNGHAEVSAWLDEYCR